MDEEKELQTEDVTEETDTPVEESDPVEEPAQEDAVEDGNEGDEIEESGESDSESDDYTDDFSEWRGQFDIPEDINSPEELAEYAQNYKGVLPEMKRLQTSEQQLQQQLQQLDNLFRAQGTSISEVLKMQSGMSPAAPVQPGPQGQQYTMPSVSTEVQRMVDQGLISHEDIEYSRPLINAFESVTSHRDAVMGYTLNKQQERIQQLESQLNGVVSANRAQEYRDFTRSLKANSQNKVDAPQKEALDKIMEEYPMIKNYHDAMAFMKLRDPKSFLSMVNQVEKTASNRAIRKLKFKQNPMRPGGKPSKGVNFKDYIDRSGEVNHQRLLRDFPGDGNSQKREEVLNKILDYASGR